jgi:cold shock CspA family protein
MTGKIKVFWKHRHFGFIKESNPTPESSPTREIFFHEDNLAPDSPTEEGTFVSYDVGDFNGRRHATNIRALTVQEVLGGGK